jgi:hypothetical protein
MYLVVFDPALSTRSSTKKKDKIWCFYFMIQFTRNFVLENTGSSSPRHERGREGGSWRVGESRARLQPAHQPARESVERASDPESQRPRERERDRER